MVRLAHFIGRWAWAPVVMVLWLIVGYSVAPTRPPYDGRILCPTNVPNCHNIPAAWPGIEPWFVAAGFLVIAGIAVVAWSQRQISEPR